MNDFDNVALFFQRKWRPALDAVPLCQAAAAARCGRVLCREYRMAAPRGLPAVFRGLCRRKSLCDEICRVLQHRIHAARSQVCNVLWRQSLSDGLYGSAGNLLRSGSGTTARYVGSQPALMVTGAIGRHITIAADYEYFRAGPVLRESGPSDNVSFFATWVGFVF